MGKSTSLDNQLNNISASLRAAYNSGSIEPVSILIDDLSKNGETTDTAYQIQEANTKFWISSGRKLVGRKIGLTSPAVQQQLGVSEPDYGMLFDDMMARQNGTVIYDDLIQPKIEAEIAFRAAKDLDIAPISEAELVSYLDAAYPALEIVDSRIRDWKITLADTVSDNASSALYVLGDPVGSISNIDLVGAKMKLYENNEIASQGLGSDCLGNPLTSTLWLVRKMIEVGRPIKAGDIILSGALGPMITIKSGSQYQAQISGIGSVTIKFKSS